MYYLVTITGSMISGRFITKTPPAIKFCKTVHDVSQKQPTKQPESLMGIVPLTKEELYSGAGLTKDNYIEGVYTENQIIRMYLDKNN